MQRRADIISYRILLYLLCSRLQIHDQNQFELIKSTRGVLPAVLALDFSPCKLYFLLRRHRTAQITLCKRKHSKIVHAKKRVLFRITVIIRSCIADALNNPFGQTGIISQHLSYRTFAVFSGAFLLIAIYCSGKTRFYNMRILRTLVDAKSLFFNHLKRKYFMWKVLGKV